ncbi:MAG: CBS domain-containing protein [Burkholderiales bacterium]|nr:CBS domain-containing protein [Burkholderiales bacterium]
MGLIRMGSKPPCAVSPGDTAAQAAVTMTGRQVGAATVVDGDEIVGVITERDVLGKVVAAGRDPATTHVRDIMSSPALCVQLRTSVEDAAEMMRRHHIRHLVVVDENQKLVGMLALRYLLYEMMDDMHRNVGDLVGFIMSDGPGG